LMMEKTWEGKIKGHINLWSKSMVIDKYKLNTGDYFNWFSLILLGTWLFLCE